MDYLLLADLSTEAVVTIAGGIIGTLVTAIGYMFKLFHADLKDVKAENKECREDREQLWSEHGQLKEECSTLKVHIVRLESERRKPNEETDSPR